ncbi:hypothetical protein FBHYGVHD_CDS0006 [Staphylococcus phage MVC_VPHSA1]|uniref:Uncharacterized protein n=1 Tax=Staphylococcus phage MVC_VPHSA1 TaxID=3088876 RepID=A0ABZ0QYN3_9CAUD|nr:hypothetical protein FBHYGVHD_CDS0006 [Staphylococcus phage MVC_VPHSA1]
MTASLSSLVFRELIQRLPTQLHDKNRQRGL